MPRGYRLLVIALGLAISCANHGYAEGSKQQPQAEQSVAKSLRDIASTNNQQAERAKRSDQDEAPCGQGQYGSSAELCAQWKAADAAATSAWWAWASGIAGIGSLVGVIFALGLALHSNWIARDTAKRQLRAYVSISGVNSQANIETENANFLVEYKNAGQTPATDLRTWCGIWIDRYPLLTTPQGPGPDLEKSTSVVLPNGTGEFHHGLDAMVAPDTLAHIRAGEVAIYIFGEIEYQDVFGERHLTSYRFFLGEAGLNGGRLSPCADGNTMS